MASGRTGWDLDPADSLSDSDGLSEDSELLFDSLPCPLPGSLPCSLSDWLPESEPEASSDAELLDALLCGELSSSWLLSLFLIIF